MVDVFAVADIMIKHVKAHYSEDVAIAAYYGSYAQGAATGRSDLDFFFIPATPRGRQVELQFVVDGISFDFWPLSWERAEKMASFAEPRAAIIADSRLLHVRSEADRARFTELRDTIAAMQKPIHARMLADQAEAELRDVYVLLYKMRLAGDSADLSFCRTEAHRVAGKVLQSLALLNQTYFTRGPGRFREQIQRLRVKPPGLERWIDAILTGSSPADIRLACERLTSAALELVSARQQSFSDTPSYPDRMKGYYEEAKGSLDKISSACEQGDYDTAFFAAVGLQDELARFLYYAEKGRWPGALATAADYRGPYDRLGLPDLARLLDPADLSPLKAAVERLDEQLQRHLVANGVPLRRFATVGEFEAFLNNRCVPGEGHALD